MMTFSGRGQDGDLKSKRRVFIEIDISKLQKKCLCYKVQVIHENGIITNVKTLQTFKDHKSSAISDGFLFTWFQNDPG